jgi:uncharacterized protein (DUF302 family)
LTEVQHGVSRYSYSETCERLIAAIADSGSTLFGRIDQQAAARAAGLDLRPTTLLIFGNPRGGTPLMDAWPLAALDLPLKLLVWEEDAKVSVAYVPVRIIAGRYGVTGKDALVQALDGALAALVAAVA